VKSTLEIYFILDSSTPYRVRLCLRAWRPFSSAFNNFQPIIKSLGNIWSEYIFKDKLGSFVRFWRSWLVRSFLSTKICEPTLRGPPIFSVVALYDSGTSALKIVGGPTVLPCSW